MLKNRVSLKLVIIQLLFLAMLATPTFAANMGSTRAGDRRENALEKRLSKTCEARQSALITRMEQLTKLVSTMESNFDKIAQKVILFYDTKVITSGKAVPNYEALVMEIANKKSLVQRALATAQVGADSFDCTTGDPKSTMTKFRNDMQAVKVALGNYRTSVKNLIVAIKPVSVEIENKTTK